MSKIIKNVIKTKQNRVLSKVLNDRSRMREMGSTVGMLWQHSRLVIQTAVENYLSFNIII